MERLEKAGTLRLERLLLLAPARNLWGEALSQRLRIRQLRAGPDYKDPVDLETGKQGLKPCDINVYAGKLI